ncbi:hypothetical protein [Mesorhizobium sp. A623]
MTKERPYIDLNDWMIYRVKGGNKFSLVGNVGDSGRIASTIQTLDVEMMSGTAERGFRFRLVGEGGLGLTMAALCLRNEWMADHGYEADRICTASPIEVEAVLSVTADDHLVFVDWNFVEFAGGELMVVGNSVSPGGSITMGLCDVSEFDPDTMRGLGGSDGNSRFRVHGDRARLLSTDVIDLITDRWDIKKSGLSVVSSEDVAVALSTASAKP